MMAGFTPAASLDRHAPELEGVSLDGGVTFSISGARFLSEHWGIGVEWAQQFSGFVIETADAKTTLYDMSIAHLHGYASIVSETPQRKCRPFAFGGAGTKFLWARDLESETKLSFGLGGGLCLLRLAKPGVRRTRHLQADDDERFRRPVISAIPSASASRRCSSLSSRPASSFASNN